MNTAKIIEVFRLTIPAMADVSDAELISDIEIYKEYVSEKRFGKLYPKALSYFIAHMRTLNDMITAAVESGSNAGDPTFTAGALIREKEGDLERGYANSNSAGDTETEALLKKTIYGQQFLMLRAMVIVPVTIRQGGGCYGWRY
jgi:hypothetical protein